MKKKSNKWTANKIKEIILKTLIIFGLLSEATGIVIVFMSSLNDKLIYFGLICLLPIPIVIGAVIIWLMFSIKGDISEDSNDYKIKYYNCTLESDIVERMTELYGEIKYSELFPENYYVSYHKENQVIIVAVMYVDSMFSEDEYIAFISEIPEAEENVISHTLIVIFIEQERSTYLKEIIYSPEYNTPWETKVFCVYDRANNRLKVNKTTNEWSGSKGYNDARKELDKIFIFEKQKKA